jgi:putative DNA primase/helicase
MLIQNQSPVTATGNNLVLAGDLTRRSLICRLDPKCEQPELRSFDFDPVARAKELRPRLIVAALTILRAFHLHGRPSGLPPLGSFEQWSRLVRDALLWLSLEDPAKIIQAVREADPELRALKTVAIQWAAAFGQDRVTVAKVVEHSLSNSELREAIVDVAGERGLVNNGRLGK